MKYSFMLKGSKAVQFFRRLSPVYVPYRTLWSDDQETIMDDFFDPCVGLGDSMVSDRLIRR